ncbi:hypothetical protein LCGC14_2474530 [marine sediment metagenome]|uniref:Uncharacterized protein n=1 Tax=marine sediment metagenome TaxID=412755 RepID=A0A0F9BXA0_9ZZZZ
MPYVSQQHRKDWADLVDLVEHAGIVHEATAGQINYFITKLLLTWLGPHPQYGDYNAAVGVLECIQLELYRRAVVPYEDKKCSEHGDVY